MIQKIGLGIIVVLIIMQLFTIDQSNPVESDPLVIADAQARQIFKDACADCHSNQTVWPWYSNIAPFSWMIADHVEEGRREMNISEFESYSLRRQLRKLEEIIEEVEEGHMPEENYVWMHPEADLTERQKQSLFAWARAEIAKRKGVAVDSTETFEQSQNIETDSTSNENG